VFLVVTNMLRFCILIQVEENRCEKSLSTAEVFIMTLSSWFSPCSTGWPWWSWCQLAVLGTAGTPSIT
jgi:hypothetical protein